MALAKGARQQGAMLFEHVEVTGVTHERGRVTGVDTARGHIKAGTVVNCCGMWARQFAAQSGVSVANQVRAGVDDASHSKARCGTRSSHTLKLGPHLNI